VSDWLDELEVGAPDPVAAFRGIDRGAFLSVRREVRRRAGPESATRLVDQLAVLAAALEIIIRRLPDAAFGASGGEADWNVAQAIGHDATARAGLVLAASLAASGRWPSDAPAVIPGIPGPEDASRETLVHRVEQSQRLIARAARAIEGHEVDPCPLEHPLVGRLRCGEWLLFAGVHDLMHLEQLRGIEASEALAPAPAGTSA
jgi:DinB superfamily